MTTTFKTVNVDGTAVFYREAGNRNRPAILLLHGFPRMAQTSSEVMPSRMRSQLARVTRLPWGKLTSPTVSALANAHKI